MRDSLSFALCVGSLLKSGHEENYLKMLLFPVVLYLPIILATIKSALLRFSFCWFLGLPTPLLPHATTAVRMCVQIWAAKTKFTQKSARSRVLLPESDEKTKNSNTHFSVCLHYLKSLIIASLASGNRVFELRFEFVPFFPSVRWRCSFVTHATN